MMIRYQTLLCLGVSLTALSGCQNYFSSDDTEMSLPPRNCAASRYVDNNMHVSASTSELHLINMDKINEAIHDRKDIFAYVLTACQNANIPSDIALIPFLTSYYDPQLITEDKAGIWQISPTMAQNFSLENTYWFDARLDIVQSTDAIIAYMKFLHSKLDADWSLVLTAYHAGLQPILDAINANKNHNMPTTLDALNLDPEAKYFTKKIAAVSHLIKNLPNPDESPIMQVAFPGQIDMNNLASITDINIDQLKILNNAFKRNLTDPHGPHRLLVSTNDYPKLKAITKDASQLRQISKTNWNYHIVKPNESLSIIAMHFETTVAEIKRVNHLKSDIIRINQKLLIPENNSKPVTQPPVMNDSPGPKRILHTVQKQDTLYHLSKKYHVTIHDITDWNQLDKNAIKPNQVITIWQYKPTDTAHFYTVKQNDSLAKIAREHKVTLASLKEANHIDGNIIHPNDRLIIPAKSN